ncbi:winged helix DNA-binding domain-containing protein [Allobranchiibius sp. GilTou73]|uniref:winged helix DNA-binding domain-containing protein n=1 Tax=Allobranchiibius sp. GilTou73 TaxID=2904523 RepID=UPI001F2375B1|nr:winged helix DNA-binding domain-containing protein [Allobranchiibius sp. GilTou73]UIJ33860.1 winged helix DNA-binding domain-containing protein [Allobranchiibius sp. GilTou73]
MRRLTEQARRRALVRRHHLAGDADGPEEVTRALVALHATDPASVYLSVLARSAATTLGEVSETMYDRRSLVRWMGMRRTLFVVARDDVPMIQAAVSASVAATLRRRLISRMVRNGTEPPLSDELDDWLGRLEDDVESALVRLGAATGTQLASEVPALRTLIPARTASESAQRLTTSVLTLMSADGRVVRSTPTGPWTSRQHLWEPTTAWWPHSLPIVDEADAQRDLAHRWLERFGPATVEDLQWWTGWTKTTTARVLQALPIEEVDLHGRPGIALSDGSDQDAADAEDCGRRPPVAALLPALDPTPMGWKHRDWFLGIEREAIFDRAGNVGPTLWWNGEIIGSWAVASSGEIRTVIVAERGEDARTAVDEAAARLHARLDGAIVTPAARTPLEQSL